MKSFLPTLTITLLSLAPLAGQAAEKSTIAPASCVDCKPSPTMTVAEFATTVATVDLLEIKLGQIAQSNAAWPSVKAFGAYMERSHTEINKDLEKAAAQSNVKIPTTLDAKHAAIAKKLGALKGEAFDQAYIPAMVEGHTKVLAMFKTFAANTTDPAFKKFATANTRVIADHLKRAEKIQAAMKKAGLLK